MTGKKKPSYFSFPEKRAYVTLYYDEPRGKAPRFAHLVFSIAISRHNADARPAGCAHAMREGAAHTD
jgi:hypothetical protein